MVFTLFLLGLMAYIGAAKSAGGMSVEDIGNVQSTWPQVYANADDNGVFILKTFLDKYDYYSMFPKFAGLPHDDSIKENKVFRRHAHMIMVNLNTVIMNLQNSKKVEGLMKALGRAHSKRGVTKLHVDRLFSTIEDIIKSAFGLAPSQLKSWHHVLAVIGGYMKEGLPQ